MFNKNMFELGSKRSVIRELFEYGKKRAAEIGADSVYDFSLGNPNVPASEEVNASIEEILRSVPSTDVHGYTSAQGDYGVRKEIACYINERFKTNFRPDSIYMTCGAAASLSITLKALCEDGDEFIVLAPFFPEYSVFIASAGGKAVIVPPDDRFFPDFDALEGSITPHTKAIIVNSPNNPSGVVYDEATILRLKQLLTLKSAEYAHPIYIIADEPYREVVYDGLTVPYIPAYYDDTVVCYSYSKSLSLPGERIGYIAVTPTAAGADALYAAICGAGRALGYVCAPSLMQYVIKNTLRAATDVEAYRINRDLLYSSLTAYGYECVKPDGAFYLFVKAFEKDANAFADRAKELGLLLVPSDTFGVKGYVRISYCVSHDLIVRSLPAFKALADSYLK